MRIVTISLLLFSYVAKSNECYMYDHDEELTVAEQNAKSIVFGFIDGADLSEERNTVDNSFRVVATFMGEKVDRLDFQSVILRGDSTSEVGGSYIIFIPKTGEVNFCKMAYKIGNGYYSRQSLVDWSDRVDIPWAPKVKQFLARYGFQP